ncbi:MAG: 6-aminohexanoate hydrolase [Halobacteriovoraceae bacterium]|jgi:L-aminopeptidase/D-esterase-like protein|nr:6-aminohexanoate hydrolase [Halobacteriovoraceae bacterium]MBC96984.1 6-aminohexanoate hydrolase [Halobacteriovoraceae bacterium]|tara:strand:+ start:35134 stop:36120 length:987 start_codon:yes stop_codon:yes gene_type:complete
MRLLLALTLICVSAYVQCADNKMILKTNFNNLEVGTAEYPDGPTGTTVLYFPRGAIGAIDIRGGAAAVREGSSVQSENTWGWVDAVVLSGGSTMGLEAADGVASEIVKLRGGKIKFDTVPAVPAAIVYDFSGRDNSIYPDKALGAQAFKARKKNEVPYGQVGGGSFVTVGKWLEGVKSERSGQGAAYYEKDGVKILVVTVLNAVGNILDEKNNIIKGSLNEETGERVSITERIRNDAKSLPKKGNTTITAVITNVNLDRLDLKRMGIMSHTSMASVISPFHTPWDGDVLFTLSTREVSQPKGVSAANLGVIASDLLRTAVWRAVGHIK